MFADQIVKACGDKQSRLVVGLDPHWHLIPETFKKEVGEHDIEEILTRFFVEVVNRTEAHAVAYKPQIAFFEQFGVTGLRALRRIISRIHEHDGIIIMDGKRNDIGSTAKAYATAFFGEPETIAGFPSDALTVNGYLGTDGIKPFLADGAHGIFVLVKTSNPSSGELQDLRLENGLTVSEQMAEMVNGWNDPTVGESGYGNCGAVIGATYPEHMQALRGRMPQSMILVPGYGAQGGGGAAVTAAFNKDGLGALINSSRGISFPKDFENRGFAAIEDAAAHAREDINSLLPK